ncbi:MAG: GTP-binding protein, partial [Lachnospiraceae bacterium]|nr:GTP-binding protein [Lachnospiraceae bacterium]
MKKIVIGMAAEVDAGKTTLSEALLFHAGTIRSMGRVDNRNTFFDTREAERERGITIFSKQAILSLPGTTITLIDTPGHVDFSTETERVMNVLDYAILVISAADGIREHTETLWRLLRHHNIPTLLFVNKMDQPGADEAAILAQLKSRLSDAVVNMTHPDPEDLSLLDEDLLAQYLETGAVDETLYPGLIRNRQMFPCFFGSALRDIGVEELLGALSALTVMSVYPE